MKQLMLKNKAKTRGKEYWLGWLKVGATLSPALLVLMPEICLGMEITDESITNIKTKFIDKTGGVIGYLGTAAAAVAGGIYMFGLGQKVKEIVMNNLGYIGYVLGAPALGGVMYGTMGCVI